jgi:iron donor protein CyaY
LIPPLLVLIVLLCLQSFVSPVYTPNRFLVGLAFGIPAGFFEEIGWMGFAFPKMQVKLPALGAAVLLGIFWGVWHMPVIEYLGTATPHGAYWLPFFLSFTAAMTALRVLIAWLYSNTRSVLLSAHARQLDRLACHLQPASCVCRTGSLLVCRLRRRPVDRRRPPRARLWDEKSKVRPNLVSEGEIGPCPAPFWLRSFIAHYPRLALFMYAKCMLDEKDFQRKADSAFEELKRRMLTAGDEHGFDVEGESGKLEVIFEEPEEAKFVISPNTPVREIWVSALSTSFKLGWNESRNAFVHEKTGEDLRAVMSRVISQQLGAQVTL